MHVHSLTELLELEENIIVPSAKDYYCTVVAQLGSKKSAASWKPCHEYQRVACQRASHAAMFSTSRTRRCWTEEPPFISVLEFPDYSPVYGSQCIHAISQCALSMTGERQLFHRVACSCQTLLIGS